MALTGLIFSIHSLLPPRWAGLPSLPRHLDRCLVYLARLTASEVLASSSVLSSEAMCCQLVFEYTLVGFLKRDDFRVPFVESTLHYGCSTSIEVNYI
ncbi:hypothetical protein BDZ97DRAFT_1787557 [Flammula alnicola]|nr:hypothetical protein BDZ97DRAFT_1887161 [Flammula alnicola]KAF8971076.1 hypothetical protein BDZ97DRAFT_1787557 [Flammula alnicola]